MLFVCIYLYRTKRSLMRIQGGIHHSNHTMVHQNRTVTLTDQDIVKQEPMTLFSSSHPPTETIFLSNIDQAVTFPVETVFFYSVSPSKSSATVHVTEIVERSVEALLDPYYFMAGRLRFNSESNRLELACNNSGVSFVSAKSRVTIEELGNLALPNSTYNLLIHRPGLYKSLSETPIFTVQVTRFKCGGFSIGFVTNHAILDGKAAGDMFLNLASICRGENMKNLAINNDRTCLIARNPLQINYPHHEYIKLPNTSSLPTSFTCVGQASPSPLIFSNECAHGVFSFTPEILNSLKQKAIIKCSTFEAIVAHLWRARTKALVPSENDVVNNFSMVLFAVDVRSVMKPPLPKGFVGNAVITAFATANMEELVSKPLSFGVGKVKEGKERVTDDYARSVIDWLEVYKGIPAACGGASLYVSAWWKLPFNELDFGHGKPVHGGPVVSGNDEFVLLLADENSGGINVWMGIKKDRLQRLQALIFDI